MDDDARWLAVAGRDPAADGAFVYAVRTTGIACRPICGSRRPRRDHVRYFASIAEAQAAGFRPCRRCRPEVSDPQRPERLAVTAACSAMQADPARSLSRIAAEVGTNPRRLQRLFRHWLGVTPREYRAACRLSGFKSHAPASATATEAALVGGYPSSPRLYEISGALGMTPGRYRAGAPGERIRFALGHSDLGHVLVGATDAGVCAVRLGDAAAPLVEELAAEFPGAALVRDDAALHPWLTMVTAYAAGTVRIVELPLHVAGSLFQLRVWAAIRSVPPGETRTYGELAAQLGNSRAARAVGGACEANPAALAIPCHRVVPRAGGIGGYRWGATRKRQLLEQERRLRTGTGRRSPEPGSSDRPTPDGQ